MGVTVKPVTNEVNELSKRVILGGAITKGSCSTTHYHTQNEMTIFSNDSIRKLVIFIIYRKYLLKVTRNTRKVV